MSQQPVPGTRFALAKHGAGRSQVPYLALHPMGFSVPPSLRRERWALTPPFHPYPGKCEHAPGRFVFCGTIRQDASRHRCPRVSTCFSRWLRGIAPFGVRTFLLPRITGESDSPPSQNQQEYTRTDEASQVLTGAPRRKKPSGCRRPRRQQYSPARRVGVVQRAPVSGHSWTLNGRTPANRPRPNPCRGCSKGCDRSWCR